MGWLYSPSTGGFYETSIHRRIPDDAVSITAARHAELLAAQALGSRIVPGGRNGRPTTAAPDETMAALRAQLVRRVKKEAARRIEAISPVWRQLNDLRLLGDTPRTSSEAVAHKDASARFAAIDAVRAASAAIEEEIAGLAKGQLEAFDVRRHSAWPAESDASGGRS